MANQKITQTDLSRKANIVKRSVMNKIKKGQPAELNKTKLVNMIAEKLGVTPRTLWNGKWKEWIDVWHETLLAEKEVTSASAPQSQPPIESPQHHNQEDSDLLQIYKKSNKELILILDNLFPLVTREHGKLDFLLEFEERLIAIKKELNMS